MYGRMQPRRARRRPGYRSVLRAIAQSQRAVGHCSPRAHPTRPATGPRPQGHGAQRRCRLCEASKNLRRFRLAGTSSCCGVDWPSVSSDRQAFPTASATLLSKAWGSGAWLTTRTRAQARWAVGAFKPPLPEGWSGVPWIVPQRSRAKDVAVHSLRQ
eukprot:SAG31_NODE_828_length_11716_cov_4.405785_14_plen_157_part_00